MCPVVAVAAVDMVAEGVAIRSMHAAGRTIPGDRACFPFGAMKRIRFEDSRDGSCRNLSPAPRAHLNEVRGRKG